MEDVDFIDQHTHVLRIREGAPLTPSAGEGEGSIAADLYDSVYGYSAGRTTFMGWSSDHLPYSIEFDNFFVSQTPGELTPEPWFIWGWGEISWFTVQPAAYRRAFLIYAWREIRRLDSNGFLQLPGRKTATKDQDDPYPWPEFHANNPSSVLPDPDMDGDGYPDLRYGSRHNGYGLEDTIREIYG